jgi:hypothetical protein
LAAFPHQFQPENGAGTVNDTSSNQYQIRTQESHTIARKREYPMDRTGNEGGGSRDGERIKEKKEGRQREKNG